jgi:NAD(P)-dependent dehydrogenase (short-subunit alcohol dehydrogenase family)
MNTENSYKKIAVVSGGFGYVGLEIIKQLSANNFLIAALFNSTEQEKIDKCMKELHGDGHQAYKCNLEDMQSVQAVFDLIEEKQGIISVCVHAAGKKPERKKIHLTTVEEFDRQIKGNLITSFNFLTTASNKLKKHKIGMIIGITTIGVIVPDATKSLGAYIPAKYAVQGILTMLKDEMLPYGVDVYSVTPGLMPGGMNEAIPKAFIEMVREKSASKKITDAVSVARLITQLSCRGLQPNSLNVSIAPEYII